MSYKCISLQEGSYEYKYIVDGEWMCNNNELIASVNKDGHVNNYVQVRFSYLALYCKEGGGGLDKEEGSSSPGKIKSSYTLLMLIGICMYTFFAMLASCGLL